MRKKRHTAEQIIQKLCEADLRLCRLVQSSQRHDQTDEFVAGFDFGRRLTRPISSLRGIAADY